MQVRDVILVCAIVVAPACTSSAPQDATAPRTCTADMVYALVLSVRDATTQKPNAVGAVVSASVMTDVGTFSETQTGSDSLLIPFGSMPGTYDLLVKKPRYANLTQTGIVVPSRDVANYHPRTVSLDLSLRPNS